MIKMFGIGKKDPKKTFEEFKKYYLEQHAPLFLETCDYAKKYVINLALTRPGKENVYDFITAIYWDDMDAIRKFFKSEDYKNIIQPDEVKMGISAQVAFFEEFVIKNAATSGANEMAKQIVIGKKNPKKTFEEFKKYYVEKHSPLAVKTIEPLRKYVVNMAIQRPGRENPLLLSSENVRLTVL